MDDETSAGAPARPPATATWWWCPAKLDAAEAESVADFARAARLTDVFVSVPWAGPSPATRMARDVLAAHGIRAQALGGDPGWARVPTNAQAWAERARSVFEVVHLDIEPWDIPGAWPAQAPALIAGLAQAVRLAAADGPVEVDLPWWLARDDAGGFAEVAAAAQAVSIMAYRDRASDILAAAAPGNLILSRMGRWCRIAVDTTPGGPPGTTFADDGRTALGRELGAVVANVSRDHAFLGGAVHDVTGWMRLRA